MTFPLLDPTTLFVLVNATINSFKLVDHLFILTKGGPDNASQLLLYYIYQVGFSFFDTAYRRHADGRPAAVAGRDWRSCSSC